MAERASLEFTLFDENGVEVSYDRVNKMIILEGWFNYIEQMDRFEIPLSEFLKSLLIPIEDIRSAYSIDCWGKPVKTPGVKKKRKVTYKSKKPKLFRYHRVKPEYDLVCQWHECGKTFTTIDSKRKFCCRECANDWFRWQGQSGVGVKKAMETKRRRKEINQKISEALQRRKNGQTKD